MKKREIVEIQKIKYKYKSKKQSLNYSIKIKNHRWCSSTKIPVIVEQSWTPITAKSARELVIDLACSFLSFLAFQRPSPPCPRVPGLPIRELRAIDMTAGTFFSAFVFGCRIGRIWTLSQLSLCIHNPDHSMRNNFSICAIFFPERPLKFVLRSNLAESWYPPMPPY